jgi:hypothetical protein
MCIGISAAISYGVHNKLKYFLCKKPLQIILMPPVPNHRSDTVNRGNALVTAMGQLKKIIFISSSALTFTARSLIGWGSDVGRIQIACWTDAAKSFTTLP